MKIIDVIQGSSEWLSARCGIPSASNFDTIITAKGESSKQREKYLYQLVAERITQQPVHEEYQNAAMLRGKEMEDEARKFYELAYNCEIMQVGFCLNERPAYGCSPDGLVGKEGLIEIKCPLAHTQIGYLIANELPVDYVQQTQGQLLVTGRDWLDFVSYYPGIKPLVKRVKPDKVFQKKLKIELELFCEDLEKLVEKLK